MACPFTAAIRSSVAILLCCLMHSHNENGLKNIIVQKEKSFNSSPQWEQHDCNHAEEQEKGRETHVYGLLYVALI